MLSRLLQTKSNSKKLKWLDFFQDKIDQCLDMLKNASVEDEEDDEDGLTELEGVFVIFKCKFLLVNINMPVLLALKT